MARWALRGRCATALAHLPGEAAAEVLVEEFPWAGLLPAAERLPVRLGLRGAVGSVGGVGSVVVLAQVLVREATAAVHTDPALVAECRDGGG